MKRPRAQRARLWIAATIALLAAGASLLSGLATERSYLLLRSAREAGAPTTSAIRAWMTLDYVSRVYSVPVATLVERLSLPRDVKPESSIRALAEQTGVPRFTFVQNVQKAVASEASAGKTSGSTGWLASLTDSVLSIVLTFGYFGYAAVRFLGSAGLPLPDGLATILAGSLVELGRFDFWLTTLVGALFATLGDLAGYALGAWFGVHVIAGYGGRFGSTGTRLISVSTTLDRWGGAMVFVTRTIAASLGGVVNIVAGASGYSARRFTVIAVVGRLVWTLACVWLGCAVGSDIDATASFLRSLTAFVLALLVLWGAVLAWMRAAAVQSGAKIA